MQDKHENTNAEHVHWRDSVAHWLNLMDLTWSSVGWEGCLTPMARHCLMPSLSWPLVVWVVHDASTFYLHK